MKSEIKKQIAYGLGGFGALFAAFVLGRESNSGPSAAEVQHMIQLELDRRDSAQTLTAPTPTLWNTETPSPTPTATITPTEAPIIRATNTPTPSATEAKQPTATPTATIELPRMVTATRENIKRATLPPSATSNREDNQTLDYEVATIFSNIYMTKTY